MKKEERVGGKFVLEEFEKEKAEKYKTFWCIVSYIKESSPPLYYCGYYKNYNGETELKPVISHNFNDAMKLHNQFEAERIKREMNKPNWKVEEHAYF